jgi:hypothetical protein
VQNLADHHFHYGYFLRAAAAIGRYDKAWLQAYLPFFDQLRADIATYNAQGKHWAYALAALGQVDATVVADTPSYGVFCRGGSGSGCQGGMRTYVAYNAAALQSANFVNADVSGASFVGADPRRGVQRRPRDRHRLQRRQCP